MLRTKNGRPRRNLGSGLLSLENDPMFSSKCRKNYPTKLLSIVTGMLDRFCPSSEKKGRLPHQWETHPLIYFLMIQKMTVEMS